ncbi:hypothetical protein BKA62DRAFT_702666 [Auriculariales sp. MPI-PUGE-AT-0066]|nr:hypothetical protein BKA62DRAFT_702666 [Auriculariales sp. MPI-PUGE-AT-0066]
MPSIYTKHTLARGRGVFASVAIEPQTIVEISPVLLFDKNEYHQHGRHTLLDHYTFKWPDGRMALALGIGSLFNHSLKPNTSYTIKTHETEPTIMFTVLRRVEKDDELCIYYGDKLWFTPDYGFLSLPSDNLDSSDAADSSDILRIHMGDVEPCHTVDE